MSMSEPQSLPSNGPGLAKTRHPAREPQNSAADITIGSTWHGRLHGNTDRRPTVLSEPYADAHGSQRVKTRIGNRVLTPLLNSFLSDYAIDRAPVIVTDPDPSEPAIVAPPAEPAAPAHPVTIDVSGEAPVLHESHGVVAGQVRTAAAFDARNGTVSRVVVEPGDAKTFTARGIWPSHVPSRGWSVSLPAHEIATRWPKVEAPPFPTVSDPIVSKAATFLPFSAFSAPAAPRNADAWFGQDLRVYPATPAAPVTAPAEPPAAAPESHESHGVEVGQTRAGDKNNGTVVRVRVTRGDADTLVIKPIWPSRVPSADWCVALTASDIATRWPAVMGHTSQAALGALNTPIVDNKADVSPFAAQSAASGFVAIQQQTAARVPEPATSPAEPIAAPPPEPTVMHVEPMPLVPADFLPPPEAQVCDPFAQPPPNVAKCKADLTEYLMDHPGADAEKVLARMLWLGHHRATTDLAFAEMVRDGQAGMFTSDGNVCWTLLTPRALAPAPVADPAPPTPAQNDEALLALLDGYTARKIREAATHAANDIRTLYGVTPATLRPRDVIRTLVVRALGGWSGAGLVK